MNKEIVVYSFYICSVLLFLGCNNSEKRLPTKPILTQEIIDSLMKNYIPQSATYKGIVANVGAREYNFQFDSGKLVTLQLDTKSQDLKMKIFEEKTNSNTIDSVKTYYKKFELIADTIYWSRKIEEDVNFKIRLQLTGESAKSKNIIPFEMKVVK